MAKQLLADGVPEEVLVEMIARRRVGQNACPTMPVSASITRPDPGHYATGSGLHPAPLRLEMGSVSDDASGGSQAPRGARVGEGGSRALQFSSVASQSEFRAFGGAAGLPMPRRPVGKPARSAYLIKPRSVRKSMWLARRDFASGVVENSVHPAFTASRYFDNSSSVHS